MARTIKSNELAIQSYIFTTAKYDFNAYEKRIMYRLVELAQDEIKGKLECVMIQSDKLLSCSNERRKSQFYCVMGV